MWGGDSIGVMGIYWYLYQYSDSNLDTIYNYYNLIEKTITPYYV